MNHILVPVVQVAEIKAAYVKERKNERIDFNIN